MSNWKPNYSDWDRSEPTPVAKPVESPIKSTNMVDRPITTEPSSPAVNWINWIQRLAIAILICIVAWLIYRSEFTRPIVDTPAIRIDFAEMDQAANEARSQVFLEVATKASEFKDLQALIDWQDERLRAARLEAYQPWVELLTRELDEYRYDAQVAERIFRAAAQASSY